MRHRAAPAAAPHRAQSAPWGSIGRLVAVPAPLAMRERSLQANCRCGLNRRPASMYRRAS
ncbi:exported hypothetical protein [Cupriavidus phytorum]|uniref:Uncharacterized protein n=1 Tax=Cupriavidus taiwanensis TaxID=164546 RepID=A0A375CHP3_9BURK|nr:exported hypothetical protein [Cupriavidus taiwanensis]